MKSGGRFIGPREYARSGHMSGRRRVPLWALVIAVAMLATASDDADAASYAPLGVPADAVQRVPQTFTARGSMRGALKLTVVPAHRATVGPGAFDLHFPIRWMRVPEGPGAHLRRGASRLDFVGDAGLRKAAALRRGVGGRRP